MKKKIGIQKGEIKKVAQSGNQGIEKHAIAKRERGITLIALVVTIIIMLILAAVTLNMALGDNGLIQMAKFATNKYEQAADNESKAMGELEGEFPITAKRLTKDNYGDYVDYELDLSKDGDTTNDWRIFYVGDVPKNGGDGTEDEETETRVFLIAADYVPNECEALKEAQTSDHANMTPTTDSGYKLCNSKWSSIPEYHCNDKHNTSLNSEKPQCSFPEVFMPSGSFCGEGNHYYCSNHVENINSKYASSLQCTGNWGSFVKQSGKGYCANYAIGGPTLEMWVASWNEKHGTEQEGETGKILYANGKSDKNDNVGYYVGEQKDCTSTSCSVSSTTGYDDTLYFPHRNQYLNLDLFNLDVSPKETAGEESDTNGEANCWGYWLSSPSAQGIYHMVTVDYNGQLEWSGFNVYYGVRPVISLNSNVTFTKKGDIANGGTIWNIS